MLSAVIATHDDERGLLPTLAALVPGATAGIVREVIVADTGACAATAEIADIAGCRLVTARVPRGARLKLAAGEARSSWLMFLRPGLVPDTNWIDEIPSFMRQAELSGRVGRSAAVFRQRSRGSIGAEMIGLLRHAIGSRPAGGLLIRTKLYAEVSGHREEASNPERELVSRLGRRRTALLHCGAAEMIDFVK
jgi:hypothetical protein